MDLLASYDDSDDDDAEIKKAAPEPSRSVANTAAVGERLLSPAELFGGAPTR